MMQIYTYEEWCANLNGLDAASVGKWNWNLLKKLNRFHTSYGFTFYYWCKMINWELFQFLFANSRKITHTKLKYLVV